MDIMNDLGLQQLMHFPTRENNTLDLLLTSLPGKFQDIHSPDKLSDHDFVAGSLKVVKPQIKKPRRKVYLYQNSDYKSMMKDASEFAKKKYFNGYPDTPSVQENLNLITSFIQDSADKHIPSKTSRSVSSVTMLKQKRTGSKLNFQTLRREIKDDVRKQHALYVNNLVGDVKANRQDFYRYINSRKKKTIKVFRTLK